MIATTPEDLLPAVYLCTNRVGPSHEGLELGVGDSILMKVGAACRMLCGWATLTLLDMSAQHQAGLALRHRTACLQSPVSTPDPGVAQYETVLVNTFQLLAAVGWVHCLHQQVPDAVVIDRAAQAALQALTEVVGGWPP